jgi:RNA 2',3'-cyclic 3'-phosphodiesterase
VRVFAAVELPGEVRARMAVAARDLLAGVSAAKPVAEENLHVTVRFVGEVADAAVATLLDAVREAGATVPRTTAEARGFGAFPSSRRPRVVWAGIDDPRGALAAVEAAISDRLAVLGHAREDRPYSAHVTVARINVGARVRETKVGARNVGALRDRIAAAERDPPVFGAVPVTSVTVFRSELGRDGSRYTALARFPLDLPR